VAMPSKHSDKSLANLYFSTTDLLAECTSVYLILRHLLLFWLEFMR
jgi:hypothetical protein